MFYDELDGVKDGQTGIPDLTASTEFWSNLWSDDVVHNEGVSWLRDVEKELSGKPLQNEMNITELDVRTALEKMQNWEVSRDTKDQLLIDKAILKNCRRRLMNLKMAWIDY